MKWAGAVLKYCRETQANSSAIQLVLTNFSEDCDAGHLVYIAYFLHSLLHIFAYIIHSTDTCAMLALRCLGILLLPSRTKKADGDIPFIIKFVPVSELSLYILVCVCWFIMYFYDSEFHMQSSTKPLLYATFPPYSVAQPLQRPLIKQITSPTLFAFKMKKKIFLDSTSLLSSRC